MRALVKRLEMRVRTRLPRGVRRIYRLIRASGATPPYSRGLPEDLLAGCRVVSSRYSLLNHLPKGGTVAEVGTSTGAFARQILERNAPKHLHVIDIDYSRFDPDLACDPRITRHEGLSTEIMGAFPDAMFDWIYIDGDHAYASVLADARCAAPKLKPGGLMIFNDFAHVDPEFGRYGVHQAVVDFQHERGWPMRYFALHPHALYDVALEKA